MVCREARSAGRDPARIRFAHQDHLHIDPAATPDRLRAVLRRFSHNSYEETAPIYLMGSPEELIPRIQARIDAGVQELAFNLMTPDPTQLDLFVKHVRPHLHPRRSASRTP
jgi:alkanesulfonate monooxygenase SsuD/methylene tetrahydromethanopterin reductase-like flavin-dependent oxidoreductase (luciferase family)